MDEPRYLLKELRAVLKTSTCPLRLSEPSSHRRVRPSEPEPTCWGSTVIHVRP